ncbi:hypothetical protein K3495_g1438 [Podosphaera aphanis]|nr:hypothetical protein K3495_g1438 [Podosphaera aphanis]
MYNSKENKKKILVATPSISMLPGGSQHHKVNLELPAKPSNMPESSWATVARNGHKKMRTSGPKLTPPKDMNRKPEACPPTHPQPSKSGHGSKSNQNDSDKRLFLRLLLEHEWRKLSPAAIRELIVKRLSVSPSYIGRSKPVRSGFALSLCNSDARECLLKAANGLFLSGAKLEHAANWTPLLVPTVPKFIVTLKGRIEITKSMLADEIERVTSIHPDALKQFGHNHPHAPHKTWMAYFSKAPRPGFRVFDQSGLISKFKQEHPIDFCKRCNGYHSSGFCSRAPSCGNCGSTMHEEEVCKALTKCRNCGGPHRSDSKKCLARPNRLGAPTKCQPTDRAGNTLDLAWTNISGTCAWVDRQECVTSDHFPVCGYVPNFKQSEAIYRGPLKVPRDKLPQYANSVSQWIPPLSVLDTEDVERFAQRICLALTDALKAVGRRPNKAAGRSAPWWTSECKHAKSEYRAATTETERISRAKYLRATVASEKKEYWKRQVESICSLSDTFKGRLVSDQEERASILRDNLLARNQASDDLPPTILTGETKIPWTDELSEIEVRKCTIGSGNNSPGADGISVELLSACWDSIGTHITQLFHACIRLGYHPSCFKLAEIVLLPKPGRDLTSVKGWRPIAFLSCLGKGLERVIARRMSFLAVTSDIVGSQQFGASPKRSANDLVSCDVHDIEEARSQGWALTFVTLDVQGAFDAVLHNQLLSRMKTQGWPEKILRWTASFLSDRLVQVRFPGGVTSPKNLVCGVPQGSPIFQLLFLLYLAEPMRSRNTRARFSYADDIGILGFGRSINESAAAAQDEVNSLLKWANDNAVAFDIEKSEVVQFSGRHREEPVGIQIGHTRIEPAEHIRWLGVYLDSRLSFKHHVATWCGKALKVAHHMRRLNPVLRGAAPSPLVAAVSSCVVPVATFGADVWWPGLTRPTARGNVTPTTTHLCSLIEKSVHLALRAALPV